MSSFTARAAESFDFGCLYEFLFSNSLLLWPEVKGRWGYNKLASSEKESGPQIEKRKGEENHNPQTEAKF